MLSDEEFVKNLVHLLGFENSPEGLLNAIEEELPAFGMVDVSSQFKIEKGSVYFIGAKQIVLDNIRRGPAKDKLSDIIRLCDNKGFSAIIIDSASGNQEIANSVHDLENGIIVYCMRLTNQFRLGTYIKLLNFIDTTKHVIGKVKVILLPVAIPNEQYEKNSPLANLRNNALDYIHDKVEFLKRRSEDDSTVIIYDDFTGNGVPEVESFKWYEKILMNETNINEDEKLAMDIFEKLGEKIISIATK